MANILLVDDEKIVLIALCEELERAGHSVQTALDGESALKLVRENSFDIVFTDLIMPGKNGVEICRTIKELSPSSTVVLISGYAKKVLKYKLDFVLAGGNDEFLMKPLAEGELIRKTEKILQARAMDKN
jgi:YesN/AraC family two-component response regulator